MNKVMRLHRCVSLLAAFSVLLLLAGCGGDDDEPAGGSPPSQLSLTGTPSSAVTVGTAYSFQPTANNTGGNSLSFSIANKPAWADFNTATGRLQGAPTGADVGLYGGIVISVTNGQSSASLGPFSINVVETASGAVTLTWTPPTENVDGSPLTDLAGYRVYWGTAPGQYPNSTSVSNPGLSTYLVENLTPATYYFVVTAFNMSGVQSAWSNTASKTVE